MISGWKKLMLLEKSISFLFPRIFLIKSSKYQGAEVEGWWQGKDGAQSLQQTTSSCPEARRSSGDEVFSRGRQRGGFGIACLIHFMIHFQAWRFRCLDQTRTVDSFVHFTPWQDMLVWDWPISNFVYHPHLGHDYDLDGLKSISELPVDQSQTNKKW